MNFIIGDIGTIMDNLVFCNWSAVYRINGEYVKGLIIEKDGERKG
jgi:hypothetical protein